MQTAKEIARFERVFGEQKSRKHRYLADETQNWPSKGLNKARDTEPCDLSARVIARRLQYV
jgi:hypothetical protein